MNAVIDVSGIAELLFKKEKCDKFIKILNEANLIFAPDLYISELTNTLWKYNEKKIFTVNECVHFIQAGIYYVDTFIDSKILYLEAFYEGIKNNHSVYDMFYMVCARRNGAILITNDSELAEICKKNDVKVCS